MVIPWSDVTSFEQPGHDDDTGLLDPHMIRKTTERTVENLELETSFVD